MTAQNVFTLVNPETGNLAFKILYFDNNSLLMLLERV